VIDVLHVYVSFKLANLLQNGANIVLENDIGLRMGYFLFYVMFRLFAFLEQVKPYFSIPKPCRWPVGFHTRKCYAFYVNILVI